MYFLYFILFFLLLNVCYINYQNTDLVVNSNKNIQRGSKIFFDYCQGCHNLKYIRYSDIASGLDLQKDVESNYVDNNYKSLDLLILNTLMKSNSIYKVNDNIKSTIDDTYSIKWFGKIPPDLSLVAKYRSIEWIHKYLTGYYYDNSKIFGCNNLAFPDVLMPHILLEMQGIQIFDGLNLQIIKNGYLSNDEYFNLVYDLKLFLSFVSDPHQYERKKIGLYLIIPIISLLTILMYILKKKYDKEK